MNEGKIALLITSRHHHLDLIATVKHFHRTAFRPDLLSFRVRVDDDDEESMIAVAELKCEVNLIDDIGHGRPKALGTCINRLAAAAPADLYFVLNDDVSVSPANWDLFIRSAFADPSTYIAYPALADANFGADYPIFSRRWYDAVEGQLFTDYFPFWFDDRWAGDVHRLVTNKGFTIIEQAVLCARKTKTQRMRDLAFWFDYYLYLEPERFRQVQDVMDRLKMGINLADDEARIEHAVRLRATHEKHREDRPKTHATMHDDAPPDHAYMAAKDEAISHMNAGTFPNLAA